MDDSSLDVIRLRLPSGNAKLTTRKSATKPPRHRSGEWFLKGPIPGSWLELAAALNIRALRVALALWFEAGMSKKRTVRLPAKTLRRFSVPKDGSRKGLAELRKAGLITITQSPGRRPAITIVEVHE